MTVVKFIALTFIAVLHLTNSCGQSTFSKDSIVSQITQICQQTNNYKNYKLLTIDDSETFLGYPTDNGGSLKGFYKEDSLKKIVEWVGLSNRVIQNEYYFNKGKLIFVYSTDSRYKFNDSTGSFDCSKFNQVYKTQHYFSNDKLIDIIFSDKEYGKTKKQEATDFLTSSKAI